MVVVLMLMGCQRYAADLIAGVARFRHPLWHVVAVSGGLEGEPSEAKGLEGAPSGTGTGTGSNTETATARWKEISAPGGDARGAVSMLRVAAADTYAGLAEKVFAALREVRRRFGASLRGVFKTDDDIELTPPPAVLASFLCERGGSRAAWAGLRTAMARGGGVAEARLRSRGHTGDLPPAETLRYPAVLYCYGAGYWLRADVVAALLETSPSPPCVLEDVSVGIVLNRLNLMPQRLADVAYRELPRIAAPAASSSTIAAPAAASSSTIAAAAASQ